MREKEVPRYLIFRHELLDYSAPLAKIRNTLGRHCRVKHQEFHSVKHTADL